MKVSTAVRNAWRAYTASFGQTMKFLLIELCLVMICLAPLLFLTDASLAPFAAGAAVLWLLVRVPGRMNAALAMRDALRGGRQKLGGPRLAELAGYGKKLVCGLKRGFFLLLWSIPLIALAVEFRIHFSGEVDSFTVLRMIKNDLGGGDQMRGILVVAGMLALSLIVFVLIYAEPMPKRQTPPWEQEYQQKGATKTWQR